MIPKAQSIKEQIVKLEFIKIKNSCSLKDMVEIVKDNLNTGRQY